MRPMVQMRDVWTVEDLQSLDVQDWWRYEIVDGALVVSPNAGGDHELSSADLRATLWEALPPGWVVVGPMGVDIPVGTPSSYLVPDLVVAERAVVRGAQLLQPAEVRLVVEIVSPGSRTMDRVVKPAKYAAAGIPNYWRVENNPVSLTAYTLPAGANVYVEVATWRAGETARLAEPFPVEIEIDRLS